MVRCRIRPAEPTDTNRESPRRARLQIPNVGRIYTTGTADTAASTGGTGATLLVQLDAACRFSDVVYSGSHRQQVRDASACFLGLRRQIAATSPCRTHALEPPGPPDGQLCNADLAGKQLRMWNTTGAGREADPGWGKHPSRGTGWRGWEG